MNHDFDTKIKNAMKPSWEADVWLNQKIIDKIGEGNYAKRRRIKNPAAAALAICFVMLSSIGVVAAAKYFHAAHVAERIGDKKLSKAFRENILSKGGSEDAMTLYQKFRGQEPSIDPLLKRKGLK